jgi:hypothetical protein
MLEKNDVRAVEETTRQKIAIILDQTISPEEIHSIIDTYETCIDQNPENSLRIFYLRWSDEDNQPSQDDYRRLQIVDATE